MSIPGIAIVGRPNVGKSSLLNRLARRRVSIVAPLPGVTRDRVTAMIEIEALPEAPPRLVEVTDTGGFGAYTAEGARFDDTGADLASLAPEIVAQIDFAIDRSELILLVVDAQAGLTALDQSIAGRLRARGAAGRVICVANKADSESWDAEAAEASRLGFEAPMCVSATNGRGIDALLEALGQRLGPPGEPAGAAQGEMKLAIVGRRNAGKSTLVNALAGEPRVIVSEIAGTTRDAVDVRMEIGGRALVAIDTAGVRKKKSFADEVESHAYRRMLAAVERADVVVFLVDATAEVSQVDKKLSQELQRLYKPTVVAVSKWDLVDRKLAPADYLDYLTRQLRGLDFAPIVCLSAGTGQGIHDVVAMAFNLFEQASHWEPTAQLNRIMASILERRGPTSRLGKQAKVYYVAQIDVRPPTFALVVNRPELFEGAYERYLRNRLHEALACSEVPIRLVFRARRRVELA